MLKNLSLILNGVLFIAVIILYVLFFGAKNSNGNQPDAKADVIKQSIAPGDIVYVNIDSVLNKYKMFTDLQDDLQKKLKTSEDQLFNREKNLRKEFEDFQYKVSKQLITRSESEEIQQSLARKEQELYQLQNNLQVKLGEEQQVAQHKVINSIMEYLESLEGEKNYKFVLGTSFGGNILYANDNLNISNEVVKGLNEQYSALKKEK